MRALGNLLPKTQAIAISSGFEQLGLIPPLLQAVHDLGYTQPSPIQEKAIPIVLAGRDLMAGAQTGTGKTGAFALPTLQRLAPVASSSTSPAKHPVRVLVLAPTRELAIQVEESFKAYAKHLPIRSTCVYGGADMRAQIAELKRGVEVLVATPGRLLDHVQNKTVMFNQVSVLILDEADRMMDMGFMPDIRRIIALLPVERQNLLFSATFPDEIKKLAGSILRNPVAVQIAAPNAVADLVSHIVHPVSREKKRDLLTHLIRSRDLKQVLVFCGTRIGANRLAHQLRAAGVQADAIHGDKSQAERLVARPRHRGAAAGHQLRHPAFARGLRAPHRPHGPRRGHGRGDLDRVAGRSRRPRRDRKADQEENRAGAGAGLRARPCDADHPAWQGSRRRGEGVHADRTAALRTLGRAFAP